MREASEGASGGAVRASGIMQEIVTAARGVEQT
jgi:hypothetical protein